MIDFDDMSREQKIEHLITGEVTTSAWLTSPDNAGEGFKPQVRGLHIGTTYYITRGAAIQAGKNWLNQLREESRNKHFTEQQIA